MKERQFFSPATRRWLLAFVLVWALSCAAVWTLAVAYLILFFVVFQPIVFPVLMFGLCASVFGSGETNLQVSGVRDQI